MLARFTGQEAWEQALAAVGGSGSTAEGPTLLGPSGSSCWCSAVGVRSFLGGVSRRGSLPPSSWARGGEGRGLLPFPVRPPCVPPSQPCAPAQEGKAGGEAAGGSPAEPGGAHRPTRYQSHRARQLGTRWGRAALTASSIAILPAFGSFQALPWGGVPGISGALGSRWGLPPPPPRLLGAPAPPPRAGPRPTTAKASRSAPGSRGPG